MMKEAFLGYCCDGDTTFCSDFVKIGKTLEGINQPDIVTFHYNDHEYKGFLKKDDCEFNNNSLEFVLYQLSKPLKIELAKTIRLYSDSSYTLPTAIVSIDVADGAAKEFISFREMRDELYIDLKNQTIPQSQWIANWSKIRARKGKRREWGVPALSDSEYIDCLKFPFEIAHLWCGKHGFKLKGFSYSLAQMVCFDILIGQADRSPSNYGLLIDYAAHSAKLAPLFDNATITKPYFAFSKNNFNQLIMDRKQFARAAQIVLKEDFKKAVDEIYSKKQEIYEIIETNKHHLPQETYHLFAKRIHEGMILYEKLYS